MSKLFRTGYVTLLGRPNVGKSSLLNRLIGQKLSITSDKPQTTRTPIRGIYTDANIQIIFIDTPGHQTRRGGTLNQRMNHSALQSVEPADVILWVVEALKLGGEDRKVLACVPQNKHVVVAVNKVDAVRNKSSLLPFLDELGKLRQFDALVPVSARTGRQVPELLSTLTALLPIGERVYSQDEVTDRNERFLAAEILREKVFRSLGDEVPYSTAVEIEAFEQQGRLRRIASAIIVQREGQKAIVIGQGGERLKKISSQARKDMEALFGGKVFLEVWVKVRAGWDEDPRALTRMGYA